LINNEVINIEASINGKSFELETGKMAKQASGAVMARYEGTVVLATVVSTKEKIEGEDFLPLTINYQEKSSAAGKIPGGYFKREGRPSEKEVLTSRLIDRPIRPLIPKEFSFPTQVIVTVLSADKENDPDVLSITAASAALTVSDIPFEGPLAAVRVGRKDNDFICNPTRLEIKSSDMNIIVAGTEEAIVMVEGGANIVNESDIVDALMFAHENIKKFINQQKKLIENIEIIKREIPVLIEDEDLIENVSSFARDKLKAALMISSKIERKELIQSVYKEIADHFSVESTGNEAAVSKAFDKLMKDVVRGMIVKEKIRIDGRSYTDIRNISGEVSFLPRTHGSALFTRGETQAIVTSTLGTTYDEQRIDSLEGDITKSFMLHYNFPPFCVGEVGHRLGPGRREIGHGALAERALLAVLPKKDDFPYTIRVVSDVLESNGSSSMATVCGASLSLLDAGVPISDPVGGIAMGLIKEVDDFVILSDILGDEDHLGDMDFKVAGTKDGVTALQMDIKVKGVTKEILTKALNQAREARLFVLNKMNEVLSEPRSDISIYAPKIITININPEKIKDVIGPSGKNIKKIIETTGVQIDIDDSGKVNIASTDRDATNKARSIIEEMVKEIEIGKIYLGTVKKILDFGAIVEIAKGKDGLVHISELAHTRVKKVTDILEEGDELLVKCLAKENDGKVRLSRKAALDEDIESYRNKTN